MLNNYVSSYVPYELDELLINRSGEKCCAFIDITDFHLDKRDIKETPVEQRVEEFFRILENLLRRSYLSYYLELLLVYYDRRSYYTDR